MDRLTGHHRPDLRQVVLCYDIADDARRSRAAQELLDSADRVEWSHFSGWLPPIDRAQLWARLAANLGPGDVAMALCLCRACSEESGHIGAGWAGDSPGASWLV